MIKFLILAVCGLACLTRATPAKLTKEFGTAQQIERQHALEELQNFFAAFVKLVLKSPERAVANVDEVLTKNSNAEAEEVLDAFNDGLNARIFVINEDYVEIDKTAFVRMLFENTHVFARVFYPSLQQRSANSMYQRKLQEYVSAIEFKQPLEQFNAVLTTSRRQIGVRAFSPSFIINSIALSISSAVSGVILTIASLIVNVLTAIITLINNVLAWLQTRISWLFTLLNPIGTLINNILQQIINAISSLLTSVTTRRRRDVSADIVDSSADNVNIIDTLLNYLAQTLASIIGVFVGTLVSVLTNVTNLLTSAIAQLQTTLDTILGFFN